MAAGTGVRVEDTVEAGTEEVVGKGTEEPGLAGLEAASVVGSKEVAMVVVTSIGKLCSSHRREGVGLP